MQYILFDSNIYLALVIPVHMWKESINKAEQKIKELTDLGKVALVNTGIINYEIRSKVAEISKFIVEEFKMIISGMQNLDQPFNKLGIIELERRFSQSILAQQDYKTKTRNRDLLLYIEDYLLNLVHSNIQKPKNELLFECFNFVNKIKTQLLNEFANYTTKHGIRKIPLPDDKKEKQLIEQIENKVAIKNNPDAKILSLFIYFLQKEQKNGLFITHDFVDFLINANRIEKLFPRIFITRPSYIKCLIG